MLLREEGAGREAEPRAECKEQGPAGAGSGGATGEEAGQGHAEPGRVLGEAEQRQTPGDRALTSGGGEGDGAGRQMPGGHGAGCGADLTRLPENRGVFPARGHLESEHRCAPFSCRLHGCDAAWPPPGPSRPQNPVRGPAWAAASSCRPRPGALDVLVRGRGATAGRGLLRP